MEELNICTLFIQTSLPPNHPTSLKVKNMLNFAILTDLHETLYGGSKCKDL